MAADLLISMSAEDCASPALVFTLDWGSSDDDCCITYMDNICLSLLTILKELARSLGRTIVSHTADGYSVPSLKS